MPPKKKSNKATIGKALIKSRFGGKSPVNVEFAGLHTTDIDRKAEKVKRLQSVTQMSDVEELMRNAELADRDFVAEKQNTVIITTTSYQQSILEPELNSNQLKIYKTDWNMIPIPRRPAWDETTTAEELHQKEKQSFLDWRRSLAELEETESVLLTPFEKNPEVWRQLWRVVERSDLIVQIVDGRNPLLFRCPDLEKYVHEVDPNKKNLLLVNKADLLTKQQRLEWAKFFVKSKIDFLFFSANAEAVKKEIPLQDRLGDQFFVYDVEEEIEIDETQVPEDSDEEDSEEVEEKNESEENEENEEEEEEEVDYEELIHVYTREELLEHFESYESTKLDEDGNPYKLTIGMVGYPNVGKSSTINVLVGEKKVAVAPTPGKTKHFQTIHIGDSFCLCDCPGLVFPTFMSTKADMICNGLLSIDNMREHVGPVTLVCRRIPKDVIERMYGIVLPKPEEDPEELNPNRPPSSTEVLQSYAKVRGFMTVHGMPNESQAARIILKDYTAGKLCYVYPPPGLDEKEFNKSSKQMINLKKNPLEIKPVADPVERDPQQRSNKTKRKKKANRKHTEPTIKVNDNLPTEAFINKQTSVLANTRGKNAMVNFTRPKFAHSPVPVETLRQMNAISKSTTQK